MLVNEPFVTSNRAALSSQSERIACRLAAQGFVARCGVDEKYIQAKRLGSVLASDLCCSDLPFCALAFPFDLFQLFLENTNFFLLVSRKEVVNEQMWKAKFMARRAPTYIHLAFLKVVKTT